MLVTSVVSSQHHQFCATNDSTSSMASCSHDSIVLQTSIFVSCSTTGILLLMSIALFSRTTHRARTCVHESSVCYSTETAYKRRKSACQIKHLLLHSTTRHIRHSTIAHHDQSSTTSLFVDMKLSLLTTFVLAMFAGHSLACANQGDSCGAGAVGNKVCGCADTSNLVRGNIPRPPSLSVSYSQFAPA